MVGAWAWQARPQAPIETLTIPLSLPVMPVQVAPAPRQWTVVGVGDVLLHGALQRQAAARGFESLWSEVIPHLQSATLAYANLEGPTAEGLVGLGRSVDDPGPVFDNRVYTSYPMFNYPPRLLDALQASGVGVVSTSNNHSLDRGAEGVRRTIAALDARGLAFSGTKDSSTSTRPWHALTHADGLTVAWVACTYGTNGIPDREGQVMDCYKDQQQLLALIRSLALDEYLGAIFVTPHWGEEYANKPNEQERRLGRALIDAGATAVLGAHSHVPQPLEVHTTPAGRQGVIAYSLGNFVSGQFHRLHTRASVLVKLHLEGQPHARAVLKGVEVLPLEMTRDAGQLQVRPLPFPDQTPAVAPHLESMFGPARFLIPLDPRPEGFEGWVGLGERSLTF